MASKLPQSGRVGEWRPGDEGGEELARFELDRAKAWLLLATHCLLPTFILWRMSESGAVREDIVALLVVVGVFGFAAWSVVRELRTKGPAVILERGGFRDFRRGPELVRWEQVAEASMKRGILSRGVKIMLADGNRVDIDSSLLKVRPRRLTEAVVGALRAWQAEHEPPEEEA